MHPRSKYKDVDEHSWTSIKDPAGTLKFDGASFWMSFAGNGAMTFHSRRPSVKGGYPERSSQLPHLVDKKYPELAGQVINVELVHNGFNKANQESPSVLAGILNSLPERSIRTQQVIGPVRAVMHGVVNPSFNTYAEKLAHLKKVEETLGKPDLIFAVRPIVGHGPIRDLINSTKARNQEGIIITSLSEPEATNVRYKVKHKLRYNLKIVGMEQEFDISGQPKDSMGSLICADSSGKVVANVGTGFTRDQRRDFWENRARYIKDGDLVQVETMGLAANRLRAPSFKGMADGELDLVN